jgi:hypothetical protein
MGQKRGKEDDEEQQIESKNWGIRGRSTQSCCFSSLIGTGDHRLDGHGGGARVWPSRIETGVGGSYGRKKEMNQCVYQWHAGNFFSLRSIEASQMLILRCNVTRALRGIMVEKSGARIGPFGTVGRLISMEAA